MATIAFHVGNAAALTSGDTAIRDRMRTTLGHTVDVFSDTDAQQSGYDAIVIAESCSSGDMAGKYLDTATPVMISEGALWDDFGLSSTASSTSQSDDQWNITGGTAISGGLSGTQTVFSSNQPAHNATDRASASTLVAVLTNATTRATVFYLNQGDARAGGGAAVEGKRVAFGLADAAASSAQANLWTLFDAAVTWMIGVPEDTRPPGEVYDLSAWHLTTPVDRGDGVAEQIEQPQLDTYRVPNEFYIDSQGRMVMVADVNGATTSGASGATRREFREREADYSLSAFDPATTELRRFTLTTQVDATQINPLATDQGRREAIIWQIHGESGTPPLYLAAEWSSNSSGTMLDIPRVRLYGGDPLNGSVGDFRDNPITNITTETFITIRCEVELGEIRLWVREGQVADLPATPTYTFQASEFTDVPNWYFKGGIYNKTDIGVASGFSVAKISHFELIQPGNNPAPINTTRFFLTG